MRPYHKIKTLFKRDPETNYKTLTEEWSDPLFELLSDIEWTWTEKIDGTNIRVMLRGDTVTFGGKTNNAQIPATLVTKLQERFPLDLMREVFPEGDFCLYGEGFGNKIQKVGADYIPDGQDFILFDVMLDDYLWLDRFQVEDIAIALGCRVVPAVRKGSLYEAVSYTEAGFQSIESESPMVAEGLILKPSIELTDRRGYRIVAKIKHRDFAKGELG